MSTRTIVTLEDDLDGGDASETIQFAIEGVEYEIDLSDQNAQKLRQALSPYSEAGRRLGGRRVAARGVVPKRTELPPQRRPISGRDRAAIQRFARANGHKVPAARGRVAAALVDAWEAAGSPAS